MDVTVILDESDALSASNAAMATILARKSATKDLAVQVKNTLLKKTLSYSIRSSAGERTSSSLCLHEEDRGKNQLRLPTFGQEKYTKIYQKVVKKPP